MERKANDGKEEAGGRNGEEVQGWLAAVLRWLPGVGTAVSCSHMQPLHEAQTSQAPFLATTKGI
jgi:hypothetical protein